MSGASYGVPLYGSLHPSPAGRLSVPFRLGEGIVTSSATYVHLAPHPAVRARTFRTKRALKRKYCPSGVELINQTTDQQRNRRFFVVHRPLSSPVVFFCRLLRPAAAVAAAAGRGGRPARTFHIRRASPPRRRRRLTLNL